MRTVHTVNKVSALSSCIQMVVQASHGDARADRHSKAQDTRPCLPLLFCTFRNRPLSPHLWCHVVKRAHALCQLIMDCVRCQAKVPNQDLSLVVNKYVLGLDVPVHNVEAVQVGQRVQQRRHDLLGWMWVWEKVVVGPKRGDPNSQ